MKKPNIGLTEAQLKGVTEILTASLSDLMVVYVKTRKHHWNVYGESFMELHKLFEAQYTQLEKNIDEVAERINKLGSKTIGTMDEFIKTSSLKESPGTYPTSIEMINDLLADHETIIKALRKAIDDCGEKYKDAGTADFLTQLMEGHETIAWTLRRYNV